MQLRTLISRRSSEIWLTGARAVLAFALALAIGFARNLHLAGLIGTLGLYAVTDGVLAASSRGHAAGRFVALEASASVALGLVMMLSIRTEHALLVLFCVRSLLMGGSEVLGALAADRGNFLALQRPHAFLAYAGLSTVVLSLSYLGAALFGYGALALHSCLAGQLALWAGLVFTHMVRHKWQRPDEGGAYFNGRHRTSSS